MTEQEAARLAALLSAHAAEVEASLEAALPSAGNDGEGTLAAAMRHGALNGGKRLRAFLAIEAARLFKAEPTGALRVAAAVECLHAYSLIHDDLPCMDDDDLRRGKPTVHVIWDDAVATLAGDALQTLAFELVTAPETHASGEIRANIALALARASGVNGMVGGQMIDIHAETAETPLTLPEIERLQSLKTGALIRFAAEAGAMLGDAAEDDLTRIRAYARDLGSAYQIRDDILDVEGDAATTGKAVQKDAEAGKATFVDLLGLMGAKARAAELANAACAALEPYGDRADALCLAARFTVSRRS